MNEPAYVIVESPLGLLQVRGMATAITALDWVEEGLPASPVDHPLLSEAARQLAAYFRGERQAFDLPLAPAGTPFQQRVWAEVGRVPFGQIRAYQDVADALGDPRSARAVGRANGQNPLPILIPCHRIVGRDRGLVGYGGGLWRKEWLLRHEGTLLL